MLLLRSYVQSSEKIWERRTQHGSEKEYFMNVVQQ